MALKITTDVLKKLDGKHNVTQQEIVECFTSRTKEPLDDLRQQHKTNPKTVWLISETESGRKLKIVYIEHINGDIEIKSAFKPNQAETYIYNKYAKDLKD